MTVMEVPAADHRPWPSLGGGICDWLESHLAFGPGDRRGEPYRLDDEKRRLVWRMYEVFPRDHPNAGRRRFRRAGISLRKGSAKTEFGAAIAAAELAADAPVRCDGWRREGRTWSPVGRPMRDPYIPLLAYTEEQSEELAYAALMVMLAEGPYARDFDIGQQRVMRRGGDGRAAALANAPDARDGARTTFELFDETHRLRLPNQVKAHRTMLANLPKRRMADAWSLEVTTAPAPGEGSVAEQTMDYARSVADGAHADARLFFFHRQAAEGRPLDTSADIRAAVLEASGPVAEWSDIDGIAEQWDDPTADRAYLARVWLNMLVRSADRAFDAERWKSLRREALIPTDGARICLGFDGSRVDDWTALIATDVETGHQWPLGIWNPAQHGGEIPGDAVDLAVDKAFSDYAVVRMYADPPYWKDELARWRGRYGDKIVLAWETYRNRPMGAAVRNFDTAIRSGAVSHNGDAVFASAIGNCFRRELNERDDRGERLWTVGKERPDSPHKIDPAVAAIISWEARSDAIAAGALNEREYFDSAYDDPDRLERDPATGEAIARWGLTI